MSLPKRQTNKFIWQVINRYAHFNQRLTKISRHVKISCSMIERTSAPLSAGNITSPIYEKNDWCDTAQRLVAQRNIKGTHDWQGVINRNADFNQRLTKSFAMSKHHAQWSKRQVFPHWAKNITSPINEKKWLMWHGATTRGTAQYKGDSLLTESQS